MTLERIQETSNKNEDLHKKIEEMKKAMDRDLSNPRTLEIITRAHSERDNSDLYNKPTSFIDSSS